MLGSIAKSVIDFGYRNRCYCIAVCPSVCHSRAACAICLQHEIVFDFAGCFLQNYFVQRFYSTFNQGLTHRAHKQYDGSNTLILGDVLRRKQKDQFKQNI